ncbi:hypothetical protein BH23VER1_BH23VER1_34980 [soil metagenome]
MNTSPPRKPDPTAYFSAALFEDGIGEVVISRFKVSGAAEIGVFLVDVYCLGVKNGFFTKCGPEEHEPLLDKVFGGRERVALSPACARKLVESSVAYAAKLGLPPHRDYKSASRVLGGINGEDCDTEFTFGKDGMPFYIQGPNDSPAFAERVLALLQQHCGEGKFHYILGGDSF